MLAWQRTVLALAVAVAAGVRFAAPLVGVVAVVYRRHALLPRC
ncbi:hypothetical protein [Cryobacterium breve]